MSNPGHRKEVVPMRDTTPDTVIARLSADLKSARLDRANLLAAMRAALAAHADGEPDPLFYLRDELNAPHRQAETRGGRS